MPAKEEMKSGQRKTKSGKRTSKSGAPAEAQKDFIVLSQGYIDPANLKQIHGLNDEDPVHSAFLLHRNGSFTKSQDDSQIPSIN